MGLFSFLKRESPGKPAETDDFWYGIAELFRRSTAGQNVTPETAQRSAAVYACHTAICESIAMLPCTLFDETSERNKRKLTESRLYNLLRHSPNSLMDSFTFFETMQTNVLDHGNAYAQIIRSKTDEILSLMPLKPSLIRVGIAGGGLAYTYKDPARGDVQLTQRDVFHLRYRSKDGILGRSPLQLAAETIGYSLALLEHGNRTFENGAFQSGFLESSIPFKDDEARDQFLTSFRKFFGVSNAGKFGLLEQGVKFTPHSMNNKDAEFDLSRKLSVLDIARIFRVPPVMIQVTESGMSYASIEQLAIIWTQYTIQPHATRYERAFKWQLLNRPDEENQFVRFNLDALIRGDLKTKTESVVQQLQYGLKTINEARHMLDEPEIEHPLGNEPMLSHNLTPISKLEAQTEPEKDSEPVVEDEPKKEESDRAEAFRPLFRSIFCRVIRRENERIRAASRKDGFMQWAESWLPEHGELLREQLLPAFIAYTGSDDGKCERLIGAYLEARQQLFLEKQAEARTDDVEHWVGVALS